MSKLRIVVEFRGPKFFATTQGKLDRAPYLNYRRKARQVDNERWKTKIIFGVKSWQENIRTDKDGQIAVKKEDRIKWVKREEKRGEEKRREEEKRRGKESAALDWSKESVANLKKDWWPPVKL